jgi:poly(A)-specific ribonuclease
MGPNPLTSDSQEIHSDHLKYHSDSKVYSHEAGYDSFLTAKILIKLAARLEAEGEYIAPEADPCSDDSFTTAPEGSDSPLGSSADPSQTQIPAQPELMSCAPLQSASHVGRDDNAPSASHRQSRRNRRRRVRRPATGTQAAETRVPHSIRFNSLLNSDNEEGPPGLSGGVEIGHGDTNVAAREPGSLDVVLMPPFHSDFWRVYGNKLRVYGTKEEIFCLTG